MHPLVRPILAWIAASAVGVTLGVALLSLAFAPLLFFASNNLFGAPLLPPPGLYPYDALDVIGAFASAWVVSFLAFTPLAAAPAAAGIFAIRLFNLPRPLADIGLGAALGFAAFLGAGLLVSIAVFGLNGGLGPGD